jgi:hypothetical protein
MKLRIRNAVLTVPAACALIQMTAACSSSPSGLASGSSNDTSSEAGAPLDTGTGDPGTGDEGGIICANPVSNTVTGSSFTFQSFDSNHPERVLVTPVGGSPSESFYVDVTDPKLDDPRVADFVGGLVEGGVSVDKLGWKCPNASCIADNATINLYAVAAAAIVAGCAVTQTWPACIAAAGAGAGLAATQWQNFVNACAAAYTDCDGSWAGNCQTLPPPAGSLGGSVCSQLALGLYGFVLAGGALGNNAAVNNLYNAYTGAGCP